MWNIKTLAKKLGQDHISEKMGMYYFLVSTLLITFCTYLYSWVGVTHDWMFYFEVIILFVITVFGCVIAFESSSGNAGKDFIKRGICLSVPIGLQIALLSVISVLLLYLTKDYIITASLFGGNPQRTFTIIRYTEIVGLNVYF